MTRMTIVMPLSDEAETLEICIRKARSSSKPRDQGRSADRRQRFNDGRRRSPGARARAWVDVPGSRVTDGGFFMQRWRRAQQVRGDGPIPTTATTSPI